RARLGDCAQLLEQAEPVDNAPVLDDAAVLQADDVDHVDLHRAAGGRDAHELAAVRPPEYLPRDHQIALGDLLEDGGGEVGEGLAETVELLPDALGARGDAGRAAVVDDVGGEDLGEDALVGAGLIAVHEAGDGALVLLLHHGTDLLVAVGPPASP